MDQYLENTIDFNKIIKFLNDYSGQTYRSNEHTKSFFGRAAYDEMIKLGERITSQIPALSFHKCSNWQNSGSIAKYFWLQLKEDKYKDSTYSISIITTKDKGMNYFKVYIELDDKNTNASNDSDNIKRKFKNVILNNSENLPHNVFYEGDYKVKLSLEVAKAHCSNYAKITVNIPIESSKNGGNNEDIYNEIVQAIKIFYPIYLKLFEDIGNPIHDTISEEVTSNQNNVIHDKNLILYGPPGTGKTYNSIIHALAIIENKNIKDIKSQNYKDLVKKFNFYREKGQAEFITFHQSYGYEEFIQGIKPQEKDGEIIYSVESGIFKRFCDNIEQPGVINHIGISIDDTPTIWKVSLLGTGDNHIRTYCMDNDCIRIGWGQNEKDDLSVKIFENDMKIGDIVFTCYTAKEIDAVGVIIGDYEWEENFKEYRRVREVKWLYKGKFNVYDMNNNKDLPQAAVRKLFRFSKKDVLTIINHQSNKIKDSLELNNKDKNYVIIIDEINRGNISKIFGETITLIEESKRIGEVEELKVKLPYSKLTDPLFGVPSNVYIIGTMNTADRSIQFIDTALRRRFSFKEMLPEAVLLKDIEIDGINIGNMLETINKRIEYLYDREHMIGHSYFMSLKNERTISKLSQIFKNNVLPLLQEYFYDDFSKIQLVLGDNQKKNGEPKFIVEMNLDNGLELFGDYDIIDGNAMYKINEEAFDKVEAYRFMQIK